MVAARLLDLRLPDFSPSPQRALSTMASPMVTDVFLRPPMADWEPDPNSLQDYVHMGTAGAIAVHAMVLGGGRIVKAIWNWATQKPQPLFDSKGDYIDFPAQLALPAPPQQYQIEDDKPTTPRPATTTTTVQQANIDQDNVQQAMSSMQQALAPGRFRASLRTSQSLSFHSQSPNTPIATLFPEPTNNDDDNDDDTALADAKAKADRKRVEKGKWGDKGDKKETEKDELINENKRLKKRIVEYEAQKITQKIKDNIWEHSPWPERCEGTPAPITQISPNASPSKDMTYIANNIEKWAKIVMQTGVYPRPQAVNGVMMDVTNIVKVEVERMRLQSGAAQSTNWTGGKGSGATSAVGMLSPSTDATADSPGQWIAQLGAGGVDGNGGGDDDGEPGDGDERAYGRGGREDRGKEFALVNPRNINVPIFTGKSLNVNPYLPFNNAIRRLILAQGAEGDTLLTILDKVEKMGANTFTNELLIELKIKYPKADEWNRVIMAALLNWTSGIAKGLVQHNVANGLDAWRKLYHRYIPLAADLQDILIRELYELKPVNESEIDSLFDEVARIKDLYIKAGPSDDLSERWIKSAVLRNLPKELVKNLAFELKKVNTIDEIQSIITIYLHDPMTGLARGQPGPLICLASQDDNNNTGCTHEAAPEKAEARHSTHDTHTPTQPKPDTDLNAVKGDKKDKSKGKGYGECWHCGQWGHPRRECPQLLKEKGDLAALKGKGKGKGKGSKGYKGYKGRKGNGQGGGKGGKGKYNYGNKGLNYYSDEDYYNAWGGEGESNYNYEDWNWGGENYYLGSGNLVFMLEKSGKSGGTNPRGAQTDREETPHPDDQPTTNHQRLIDTRPTTELHNEITLEQMLERQASMHNHNRTTVHNRFSELQSDDGDEDKDEHEDEIEWNELACNTTQAGRASHKRNWNKRQRQRRREQQRTTDDNDDEHEQDEPMCEETCDEAARKEVDDADWNMTNSTITSDKCRQKHVRFCWVIFTQDLLES